ncbi:MAG TPA: hypothetical protein VM600_06610, partial [Actinomycetota bacterium]|nr:hypothetical protein [Actinomycetota bacterium]
AEYVHVVRSVAAAAVAHQEFSFDDVEDMRLAVDEACAYLLALRPTPTQLRTSISGSNGRIEIEMSADAPAQLPPKGDAQQSMMWNILAALTDDARVGESDTGPSIVLTKQRRS